MKDATGKTASQNGCGYRLPLIPSILVLFLVFFAYNSYSQDTGKVPVYGYEVVNTYPHDETAFTQGLGFEGGTLYESTGQYGQSTLRKVDLKTGETLKVRKLPDTVFGEGMVIVGNRIIQITWRSETGFVYDKKTFEKLATFKYPGEGWGITYDGRSLIMSDGTSVLRFLNPETYKEIGTLEVYDGNNRVDRLNELEYVNGEILANIWGSDRIARIDPKTGSVTAWIDLSGLLGPQDRKGKGDVLNGIAWDQSNERLFVTGKLWPKLFEIKLVPEN